MQSEDLDSAPRAGAGSASTRTLTVLALVDDAPSRELLETVLADHRLLLASDPAHALALASEEQPDVAFVDVSVGEGAGLAMVHHIKALAPGAMVHALASPTELEAGAHAIALGGSGLILLPLAGDEVLNVVSAVTVHQAELAMHRDLVRSARAQDQTPRWAAELADLGELTDRAQASRRLADVFMEALGAKAAVVYLAMGAGTTEFGRTFVGAGHERAPTFGAEIDVLGHATRAGLLPVPLASRALSVGYVLLEFEPGSEPSESVIRMLASQATTAMALLAEREQASHGGAIKDPSSSAYSFAYYADVAGREIDKARRHDRRFSIATIALEPAETGSTPPLRAAEIADQILRAARDIDILARVDENEFHLLLPECDGLTAQASRRRVLARFQGSSARVTKAVLMGSATFPHDGQNLSQLLRVARRRAEATRDSLVHGLAAEQLSIADLMEQLRFDDAAALPSTAVSAARAFDLSLAELCSLATTTVGEALRGGAAFIAVASHDESVVGAAVRAALGQAPSQVVFHALEVPPLPDGSRVEALAVYAESGVYTFLGQGDGHRVRGIHAADPLLADLIASLLGRAAGLRIFG